VIHKIGVQEVLLKVIGSNQSNKACVPTLLFPLKVISVCINLHFITGLEAGISLPSFLPPTPRHPRGPLHENR
jgi:hypothetical protein